MYIYIYIYIGSALGPPIGPPKMISQNNSTNRIFDVREYSPRQNGSFVTGKSGFQGHKSSKKQKIKVVTVGVPETETNAILIFFTF